MRSSASGICRPSTVRSPTPRTITPARTSARLRWGNSRAASRCPRTNTVDFSVFVQLLLPGLTTGCVYALVALGFVLCANVSGVVNFAQGEYVMLGGVVAAFLVPRGVPVPFAIAAAVALGAGLGTLQERLTL